MNELEVLVSPYSVPCSSAASATDPVGNPPQIVSLELSVTNASQDPVDLSNAMLRISFPVDPGGSGSEAALILAQPGQPGVPWQGTAVQATPLDGTLWTIDPGAGACEFDAAPMLPTGSAQPGVLAGGGQGSVSFIFSQIAMATVPGVAPITVTVVGETVPSGVSVDQTKLPGIQKAQAGFGVTSFAVSPLLVGAGGQAGLTWTVVGAAGCTLSWSPPDNATVTQSSVPFANGTPAPFDTGATPFQATVTGDTVFILEATGPYTILSELAVLVARPVLMTIPFPCEIDPYGTFTLVWEDLSTQQPALSWYPPDGATVSLDSGDSSGGGDLNDGDTVPHSGQATVTLFESTTFFLLTAEGQSVAAVATLKQVRLVSVMTGPVQWDGTTGAQYVGLEWVAYDATFFDIYGQSGGGDAAWAPVAHIGYPFPPFADLPLPDVTTFRLIANGEPAPQYLDTSPITPQPARILSFTCLPPIPALGVVSFFWQAIYCTQISLVYDMTYWVMEGTGGDTLRLVDHHDLLQDVAGLFASDLTWTFDRPYNELFGVSIAVTLVAYGFENAIYRIPAYGIYGVYAALEGVQVVPPAIGVDNIRDADTPGGDSAPR